MRKVPIGKRIIAHRGFVPNGNGGGDSDSLPPSPPFRGVDFKLGFLAGGGGGGGFLLFKTSMSIFELCLFRFGCGGGGGGGGCGAPCDARSVGCGSKYEPIRSVIRCFLLNSVNFCLPTSMCSLLRCRKLFVDGGGSGAALRVVYVEVGVLSKPRWETGRSTGL